MATIEPQTKQPLPTDAPSQAAPKAVPPKLPISLNLDATQPSAQPAQDVLQLTQAISGKAGAASAPVGAEQAGIQAAQNLETTRHRTILDAIHAKEFGQAVDEETQLQGLKDAELEIREKSASLKMQMLQRNAALLQSFRENMGKLDLQRQAAQAEQAGIVLRLSNDKYVANLRNEARRAGLADKAKFQDAMYTAVFQNQLQLMSNDLSFRAALRAEERAFKKKMVEMDIDAAWDILMSEINDSAEVNKYNVVAQGASSTLAALGKMDMKSPSAGTAQPAAEVTPPQPRKS